MFKGILLVLPGNCRARPHHAHVTLQNIQELWDLIDAVLAQKASSYRQPWIVLDLEQDVVTLVQMVQRVLQLFCVCHHRAEFVADEIPPLPPDSRKAIEDRKRD